MAIIVQDRRTGNEYILLSINGGGEQTSLSSRFLNDLFPREQTKNGSLATICDARGNIYSSYLDNLIVVEIDGKKPGEILPEPINPSLDDEFEDDSDEGWQQGNTEKIASPENSSTQNPSIEQTDEFNDEEDWI